MQAMAIKINVSRKDQDALNEVFKKVGFPPQRRKFHCTIGFIEKVIPKEETGDFSKKITEALQNHICPDFPFYEVEKAEHLFGHVIAFVPIEKSLNVLKDLNLWLFEKVQEISEGRWGLNDETTPQNYIPHFTLWRTRRLDSRFQKLEEFASSHPSYQLVEAATVNF